MSPFYYVLEDRIITSLAGKACMTFASCNFSPGPDYNWTNMNACLTIRQTLKVNLKYLLSLSFYVFSIS